MTEIDKIKATYATLRRKTDFIEHIAVLLRKNKIYVRCHYFSTFWNIPEKYTDTILKEMDKWEKK